MALNSTPDDLGGRRITIDGGLIRLRPRPGVAGRDREDPVRAQVNGRRERRRESHAAVAEPLLVDLDRGKEDRQRGRGHYVADAQASCRSTCGARAPTAGCRSPASSRSTDLSSSSMR